ncbi:MFS transporter [Oceanobacillus sp. FSL W7-1293]|uniref:MFS transporter n=1 Tax=Oceanobacillus sp. FSL W7-1293 TaxID=2921699 RepID=UPI0030D3975E
MSTHTNINSQPDPKRWKALFLLCFANFLVIMDASIIQIALPSIQKSLGYTQESLQWVMSAFLLIFGGFLLLGGKLADLYGNRRIFNTGVLILAVSSLFAGLAWSELSLNIFRGIQGLGSALIAPSALSMVMRLFNFSSSEKAKALAFWGLSGAAGGAFGIVFGGLLTGSLGWRWTLFIYVPLSIIVLIFSPKLLQKSGQRLKGRIDYVGAILVTASLMLLVYGIVSAEHSGWTSSNVMISLITGVVLFLIFLIVESKMKEALLPLNIFKTPNLGIGNIGVFLTQAAWFPLIYMLILYLQQVLQYSPTAGAMAVLPVPLFMAFFMIVVAEKVLAKLGIKMTMATGFVILGLGNILFSQFATVDGTYFISVLIPSFVAALGNALAYLASTTASVSEVEPKKSGLASGLYNTNFQIGSAIGLSIMVAIAGAATRVSDSVDSIIALNEGFQQGFFWAGMFAFVGAVLTLLFIRVRK